MSVTVTRFPESFCTGLSSTAMNYEPNGALPARATISKGIRAVPDAPSMVSPESKRRLGSNASEGPARRGRRARLKRATGHRLDGGSRKARRRGRRTSEQAAAHCAR